MKHLSDNNFNNNQLDNVPTPTDAGDATNKEYVDTSISSISKNSIGLGNVDNTSDLNKPVSSAQQQIFAKRVVTPDFVSSMANPSFVAHRGGYVLYPENSMMSYEACLDAGFPIEMDVRRLSTGEFVISHDSTTDRVFGVSGTVSSLTAADWDKLTIKTNGLVAREVNQKAVYLWQVLDQIAPRGLIVPELKFTATADVDDFIEEIKSRNLVESVIVQSIDFATASYLAANGLHTFFIQGAAYSSWPYTPQQLVDAGIEYVHTNRSTTQADVNAIHGYGLKVAISHSYSSGVAGANEQLAKGIDILVADDPWSASGISSQSIAYNAAANYNFFDSVPGLDLNNITKTGSYVVDDPNGEAANMPGTATNGSLQVIATEDTGGGVRFAKQIFSRWGSELNNHETFVRTFNQLGWSPWHPMMANIYRGESKYHVGEWSDGTMITRATFDLGELGNASTTSLAHELNLANYTIIKVEGTAVRTSDGLTLPLPFLGDSSGFSNSIAVWITAPNINVKTFSNRTGYRCWVSLTLIEKGVTSI